MPTSQGNIYVVDMSITPPSCLPIGLSSRARLVDVTPVGAAWRVYMDAFTDQIYDGAELIKNTSSESLQ